MTNFTLLCALFFRCWDETWYKSETREQRQKLHIKIYNLLQFKNTFANEHSIQYNRTHQNQATNEMRTSKRMSELKSGEGELLFYGTMNDKLKELFIARVSFLLYAIAGCVDSKQINNLSTETFAIALKLCF